MANTHAYVSTMKCACTDIDALNAVGIASVDMDNGVIVKLTNMAQDSDKKATGFEFKVEAAAEADLGVWVVNTPEVGHSIETQLLSDPRYFYNIKGEPMSIKKLVAGVDYLEYTKEAFVGGELPTGDGSHGFAKIGDNGKLAVAEAAPAKGGYFEFVALHSIAIGNEEVPTVIMRYQEAHNHV